MKMICVECAELNGGKLREGTMADALVGQCNCCKKVKVVVHRSYFKNLERLETWISSAAEKEETPAAKKAKKSQPDFLNVT